MHKGAPISLPTTLKALQAESSFSSYDDVFTELVCQRLAQDLQIVENESYRLVTVHADGGREACFVSGPRAQKVCARGRGVCLRAVPTSDASQLFFDGRSATIQLFSYERKKYHASAASSDTVAGGVPATGEGDSASAQSTALSGPSITYPFKLWLPQAACLASTSRVFGERAHSEFNWTQLDELICDAAHDPNSLRENMKAKRLTFVIMPQSADMSVETEDAAAAAQGATLAAAAVGATPHAATLGAAPHFASPAGLALRESEMRHVMGSVPRTYSSVPVFSDGGGPAASRVGSLHDLWTDHVPPPVHVLQHGSPGEHASADGGDQSPLARGGPWWGCAPLAGAEESNRIARFEKFVDGLFKERKITSARPEIEREMGADSTSRRLPSSMLVTTRVLLKARATSRTTEWAILQVCWQRRTR